MLAPSPPPQAARVTTSYGPLHVSARSSVESGGRLDDHEGCAVGQDERRGEEERREVADFNGRLQPRPVRTVRVLDRELAIRVRRPLARTHRASFAVCSVARVLHAARRSPALAAAGGQALPRPRAFGHVCHDERRSRLVRHGGRGRAVRPQRHRDILSLPRPARRLRSVAVRSNGRA